MGGQRLPVEIPRIRESQTGQCVPLSGVEKLKNIEAPNDEMFKSVLHGLSTRDYKKVVAHLAENFGLSSSHVSREFIEASEQAVKHFCERTFEEHTLLPCWLTENI